MPDMDFMINRLSELAGIAPDYYDIWGKRHEVSPRTKKAVLKAMGLHVDDGEALARQLEERERPRPIEPFLIAYEDSPAVIPVSLPYVGEAFIRLKITGESGQKRAEVIKGKHYSEGEFEKSGIRYGRFFIRPSGTRPAGYYDIELKARFGGSGSAGGCSRLAVAPRACFIPHDYKKTWGMTFALYSIRSGKNWGIGDLRDLGDMVDWIAKRGGDFAGLLPLHSIPLPGSVSPYSPLSRYYNNLIYLDLESVPEYKKIKKAKPGEREKSRLRGKEFVDYEGIYPLKYRALKEMHEVFIKNEMERERGALLKAYIRREGKALEDYSTYMALDERFKGGWMSWPPEFRDPASAPVRKFRRDNQEAVQFHSYVQWLLEDQLRQLKQRTKNRGMRAGLYFDLAVGSLAGGADAWGNQEVFARGADAGSPPDDFSLGGQNWGFPPLIPEKLRETGYNLLIKTIRKNLEHAGVLRIDHALGLFRFFWIPAGLGPADGAYVKYPHEEMLAVIAIESKRANAVIVAEDLGTAGGEVRAALSQAKMLSYRLFYYERKYPDPEFVEPRNYPETAFCAVTTHDLPTLAGFWTNCDILEKKALSLYPSLKSWRNDLRARKRDRALIISTLKKEGLLPENYRMPDELDDKLLLAVYGYLARTPSLLVSVSLDDWLKTREQQNLPGVSGNYPNWRRKTPASIEKFAKGGARLTKTFRDEGRGHPV